MLAYLPLCTVLLCRAHKKLCVGVEKQKQNARCTLSVLPQLTPRSVLFHFPLHSTSVLKIQVYFASDISIFPRFQFSVISNNPVNLFDLSLLLTSLIYQFCLIIQKTINYPIPAIPVISVISANLLIGRFLPILRFLSSLLFLSFLPVSANFCHFCHFCQFLPILPILPISANSANFYLLFSAISKMSANGEAGYNNKVKVVLGAQWGDEGKGKLVDLLAEHADVVARCQVGDYI